MILIIGLGNPGEKYKNTRHNIGFRVIDKFSKRNNFPEFEISQKFKSLISEKILFNKKTIIVKPQTFMNESGKAVRKIMSYRLPITNKTSINKFSKENLIIVHDDIDILLGKIRISQGRNSAGHKGVESIIKEIGTKNFTRFRIGIKPTNNEPASAKATAGQATSKIDVEKFVIQKFSKNEEKIIEDIIEKTIDAMETFLKQGIDKAI
ncbi:MAG: aminoacyl-tRNA hydrolase [Patescibacteria group bacterium]|nr:aminoacyl-tRNA hydrolase [Patescibacteria group bacterium]